MQAVWTAFLFLSRKRPVNYDFGAIPTSEILAYFNLFGVRSLEKREEWAVLIDLLDQEWLMLQRAKKGTTQDANATPGH